MAGENQRPRRYRSRGSGSHPVVQEPDEDFDDVDEQEDLAAYEHVEGERERPQELQVDDEYGGEDPGEGWWSSSRDRTIPSWSQHDRWSEWYGIRDWHDWRNHEWRDDYVARVEETTWGQDGRWHGSASYVIPSTTTSRRGVIGAEGEDRLGKPTEKMVVPEFDGEGGESELGTSARSYLRRVAAWERCTRLAERENPLHQLEGWCLAVRGGVGCQPLGLS